MIKNIGWQTLQERRAIRRLTLMYKVVHGLNDANFTRLLNKERPTRRTNSQNCFMNIRANKNCYRSLFLARSIPEWNNLFNQARNAASVD